MKNLFDAARVEEVKQRIARLRPDIQDERDLAKECARLYGVIDRFVAAGPKGCTTHPHSFFGPLTPEE